MRVLAQVHLHRAGAALPGERTWPAGAGRQVQRGGPEAVLLRLHGGAPGEHGERQQGGGVVPVRDGVQQRAPAGGLLRVHHAERRRGVGVARLAAHRGGEPDRAAAAL